MYSFERLIGSIFAGIGVGIIIWKTGSVWIPTGIFFMIWGNNLTTMTKK